MHDPKPFKPRSPLAAAAIVLAVPVLAWLAYWMLGFGGMFYTEYRFNSIAPRLAKQISGDELQAWAQAVLASPQAVSQFATNEDYWPRLSEVSPPLPAPVGKIFDRPPRIIAFQARGDLASHVLLTWGGGFPGTYGLEIGPTNFTGHSGRTNWQAGIYYWRDF